MAIHITVSPCRTTPEECQTGGRPGKSIRSRSFGVMPQVAARRLTYAPPVYPGPITWLVTSGTVAAAVGSVGQSSRPRCAEAEAETEAEAEAEADGAAALVGGGAVGSGPEPSGTELLPPESEHPARARRTAPPTTTRAAERPGTTEHHDMPFAPPATQEEPHCSQHRTTAPRITAGRPSSPTTAGEAPGGVSRVPRQGRRRCPRGPGRSRAGRRSRTGRSRRRVRRRGRAGG